MENRENPDFILKHAVDHDIGQPRNRKNADPPRPGLPDHGTVGSLAATARMRMITRTAAAGFSAAI